MKHFACIMDGNRRWAQRKGWLPWVGHRQGVQAVKCVVDFCIEKNIPYLSLYTFSIENFKRPETELNFLFDLMLEESDGMLKEYQAKGVRVRFIGDRSLFPEKIRPVCERIEQGTAHCSTLNLNFLFCYGARQEIMGSVKQIVRKIQTGELKEDQISDELFSQHLWTSGMPEPDMILRTGGVKRLSNFLLYQAAYAECYFLDCLWPEITKNDLEKAVTFFKDTQRNYGI
ncbi:MAG: polyprenyl diphosphate synthase [Candidatus Dependentiae bacterium]|nr:polyprenyl diphosphate synthase [Candidatus Dependentiae bacterium]